jgi:hypothetical protein
MIKALHQACFLISSSIISLNFHMIIKTHQVDVLKILIIVTIVAPSWLLIAFTPKSILICGFLFLKH